jgi:BirA family biotin operon repressor/biotin-[acetyl-CoA-carboxylase] ligase
MAGAVTSCLDTAWELAALGRLPVFGSVLADSQSAGRGRQGRDWASPPGHVYAAWRLPDGPPFSETIAPMALALLLARALERLEPGLSVGIKWPNDLIAMGGKVGGILLEARRWTLVAGIGLNLGAPPPLAGERPPWAPPAAALPAGLGPPGRLWPMVAETAMRDYNDCFAHGPSDWPRTVAALVEARLLGLGRPATVYGPAATPKAEGPVLRGILAGLSPSGALRLESVQGPLEVWSGALAVDA